MGPVRWKSGTDAGSADHPKRLEHNPQMRLQLALLITILCAGAIAAPVNEYNCSNIITGGGNVQQYIYDLSPLKPDFNITTRKKPEAGDVVTWETTIAGSLCGPITTKFGADVQSKCSDNAWFCWMELLLREGEPPITLRAIQFAGGSNFRPEPHARGQALDLLFKASETKGSKTVNVSFICNDNTSPGKPEKIEETDKLITIKWESKAGCPSTPKNSPNGKGGMSTFGIFCLILFIGAIGYFVIGSAYNYTVLRIHRFPEMLPHWDFWSTLLAVCWDFVASLYERVSGRSYVRL
ncbi:uncharacterized protein SPPG_01026 [Spizellomyces punctatus DAOM BR117]|uniref:Uncharacterized protein n=1 Tax=Spizellomyces punctatus (strain DAOM BR117) TaxID=645134 RepID=A0A0L0HR57_SPIPD|nr:uncharacterized protein SPPG_01026 [Spizellomyces punctatus DAOM BR117]KND03548.1 hypothetical protein SPPG_01026 [Spizellomyces punctatus DAOM BR117]|eukprot:XP_016611587.1 hypothetical protein SPPG_01026 [Spizellomyces punctatus DAOM BR117]